MKIVILNDMLWGGGRERRIVQLIKGLNQAGEKELTLILLDERVDYSEIFDLNVNVIKIKRKNSRDLTVFLKLWKIFSEIRPDIINPWSFMTAMYAAPLSWLMGVKCIGSYVVDAKRPKLTSINTLGLLVGNLFCSKVIANSNAGHEAYNINPRKRIVIYNGFDSTRLERKCDKNIPGNRFIKDENEIIITMIGRIDPQKDFVTFIDAVAHLLSKKIKVKAYIAGQGPLEKEISEYAREKCGDSVIMTGFVKNIDDLICITDVGVLCTNPENHAEGISNAILEMMAHGVPVVATSTGGTPEIIENNSSGYLVEPKNSSELAQKIETLICNSQKRAAFGVRSREISMEKFSLESMVAGFRKVYKIN